MLYNSSACLRTAGFCLRAPVSSAAAPNGFKLVSPHPMLARQTRCLSTKPSCARIGHTSSHTCTRILNLSTSSSKERSVRHASSATAPPAATGTTTTSTPPQSLTWDGYLSLRQKRRYYNIATSTLTALGTFAGGASFLLSQDIERMSGFMFGIDPFMAMGIICIGFGAVGWLIGPFAGGFLFRLTHRKVARAMEVKEKDLYQRIKKYRSDPTRQSVQNPVPDYYGEKIFSVRGYRQWLKDQRAFRKKRESLT